MHSIQHSPIRDFFAWLDGDGNREDKFIENVDKNGVCGKTLKVRVRDAFSHAAAVLFAADQFIDTVH